MPAPTPDELALIKRFEPILFFAPGERFFPSDAKRYVEHCALWKAKDPLRKFATHSSWGPGQAEPAPAIPKGKIVVTQSEAHGDDVFLGTKDANGFKFLTTHAEEECFLGMTGWRPPDAQLTKQFDYADLEAIAAAYRDNSNLGRFWYHAEFFSKDALEPLFQGVKTAGGHDFTELYTSTEARLAPFNDPSLICYYLFFPAHDEGLQGCGGVPEARLFSSFAGEWACIAVLLDRPTAQDVYDPKYIGLTNRNIGVVAGEDDKEVRVGMRVFPWKADIPDDKDHPRLKVALGSHGLYRHDETPGPVKPFTQDDFSRNLCGLAPPLYAPGAAAIAFSEGTNEIVLKVLCSAILANFLFPGLGGLAGGLAAAAGLLWSIAEITAPPTGPSHDFPVPSTVTDTVGTTGRVLHPADYLPSGVMSFAFPWPSPPPPASGTARDYQTFVDRAATVMWPDVPTFPGYTGRWGPRVENDSLQRSGMKFPNFWRMFFEALVTTDREILIEQTDGIPIGNATGGGGLGAAYDGNKEQVWYSSPLGSLTSVYIGKRFAAAYVVSALRIWLSFDHGLNANDGALHDCAVYGKNGLDPASPTDGTKLHSFQVSDRAAGTMLERFANRTAFDRVWVTLVDNTSGINRAVFTEVEWYRRI